MTERRQLARDSKMKRRKLAGVRSDLPIDLSFLRRVDLGQLDAFVVEENVLNHNKEDVVIEGVIKYNFNSGKQTILSFHDHHKGYFKVLIKQKYYPAFSALPDVLYKKEQKIRVTGLLEWYQGDRTIFVTTPNQIEIL